MPITPKFKIHQTDDFIHVDINVPFVKISSSETYIEDNTFVFWCKPYFLKLHFPHDIIDDERCKAVYDPEKNNGTIFASIPKGSPGLYFQDLDLTTKLLQPIIDPLKHNYRPVEVPVIEVLKSEEFATDEAADVGEPPLPIPITSDISSMENINPPGVKLSLSPHHRYGFNNQYSGVFKNLREELRELMPVDPDNIPAYKRTELRIFAEDAAFDADRYLGDMSDGQEDYVFTEAMDFLPHWQKQLLHSNIEQKHTLTEQMENLKMNDGTNSTRGFVDFSADENLQLSELPNKEYLIPTGSANEYALLLGLADILFAYAYDHRGTQGEPSVESSWTVSTLSSILSWFIDYQESVGAPFEHGEGCRQVAVACMRRSLTYPYLRSWELGLKALEDTRTILKLGKRCILRCLLQVYKIMGKSEVHYLLNRLYMTDYCVWIQKLHDRSIQQFAEEFNEWSHVDKESVGLGLVKLEESICPSSEESESESCESGSEYADESAYKSDESTTNYHQNDRPVLLSSEQEPSSIDSPKGFLVTRLEETTTNNQNDSSVLLSSEQEPSSMHPPKGIYNNTSGEEHLVGSTGSKSSKVLVEELS